MSIHVPAGSTISLNSIATVIHLLYSVSLPSIIPIVMISSTPHITVKYDRLPMVEPTNNFHHFDARQEIVKTKLTGRNNRTRTCGILVPNQALYQTELCSDDAITDVDCTRHSLFCFCSGDILCILDILNIVVVVVGFEPTNNRIKTCWLTTCRYHNLKKGVYPATERTKSQDTKQIKKFDLEKGKMKQMSANDADW